MFSYGAIPWREYNPTSWLALVEDIENGKRLEQPQACPNSIYQLMAECWNLDPQSRKSFDDIETTLSELKIPMKEMSENADSDFARGTHVIAIRELEEELFYCQDVKDGRFGTINGRLLKNLKIPEDDSLPTLSNLDNNNDDDYVTPIERTNVFEPLIRPFLPQDRNQTFGVQEPQNINPNNSLLRRRSFLTFLKIFGASLLFLVILIIAIYIVRREKLSEKENPLVSEQCECRNLMEIEDEFEEKLKSAHNFTDIKPNPYKRLAKILQSTESFNSILDSIQSNELDAEILLGELSTENRYVKQANIVLQEASVLEERNNDSIKCLVALRNDVEKVRGTVHEQNSRVIDISNQLAHFSSQVHHHDPTNEVNFLIAQAKTLLEATRERNTDIEKRFNYAKKNTEDAEKLLKEILSKKLNDTSYDMLFEVHAERRKLIKEFRDEIWDNAKSNVGLAKYITAAVNKRLQTLQNTIDGIVKSHQNSKDELEKAEKVVEKIKGELLNIHDHYMEINGTLLNKARDGTEEARAVVTTYQEFLPDYHHNHVIKAEKHAKDLEHEARRLKNSFYETEALSKNALTASKAYTEIAEALRNASKATSKAKTDAEEAYGYADPNLDKSLVNKATSTIEKSRDLEEGAKTSNNKDNEESLNRIQTQLDNVKLVETDIEKNISRIKEMHRLLDDNHDRINTVHNTINEAQNTLADVQKRAENFARDVEALQKRVEAVGDFNEQTIRDEIENVTKSDAQIDDSLKQLDGVRNRAEKHDEDMAEIRTDLSVLKEKIKEAREKAAKVKIAVKSEPKDNCVREYISPAHPSPSNTISLKYRPALDVPDSLLFLTMIEKTRGTLAREFIAIELKEKRIIVHWNIGSGNRKATTSHNIRHIAASYRYTWYHIDVKRNGNSMKISVAQKQILYGESAKNIGRPTEITVGELDATNDVILNTEPGKTRISIGHSSPSLASELGLATHQFNGVLNELTVDGQIVPLWVFASQSGNCDGSAGGPTPKVNGHV